MNAADVHLAVNTEMLERLLVADNSLMPPACGIEGQVPTRSRP